MVKKKTNVSDVKEVMIEQCKNALEEAQIRKAFFDSCLEEATIENNELSKQKYQKASDNQIPVIAETEKFLQFLLK